jgi:3'(2'), 5'-bisphosphate nucleotidase
MSVLKLQELLSPVVAIAEEAGRRIMDVYEGGFDVWHKDDDSPLTAADQAAHTLIKERLQQLTPDIPILSEEGRIADYAERGGWQRYWLVDPLDGTKEFVKRNDEFTVNIALIVDHEPVLGVVHAPAQGVSWYAAREAGSFKAANGEITLLKTRAVADPMVVMVSRSHRGERVDALLQRLESVETQSVGSSIKFCLVAEGSADLYPRFGPTSEWDSAAAQCVVEQAGGRVTTLDLQPLRYNTKESLLNPDFMVFGDDGYDWAKLLEGLHGETR